MDLLKTESLGVGADQYHIAPEQGEHSSVTE